MMNFNPNNLCWYMAKIYQENKGKSDKVIICNEGGSRCLFPDQLIVTDNGSVKISDIKLHDNVLSYNEITNTNEYKKVLDVIRNDSSNKKSYCIKLKNGKEIKITGDHKIYFRGRYIEVENFVYLYNNYKIMQNGNMENDT